MKTGDEFLSSDKIDVTALVEGSITNASDLGYVLLGYVLAKLSQKALLPLIDKIGIDFVQKKITNVSDLCQVVRLLSEETRLPFIDKIGIKFVKERIKSKKELDNVLLLLDKEDKISLSNAIGKDFIDGLTKRKYFDGFLGKKSELENEDDEEPKKRQKTSDKEHRV